MRLRFVGSGDAFGSGGRLQTCLHLQLEDDAVLVDCGASSLIGMQRLGIDPSAVGHVLVSHLHGDHFGGLPFLILHGQFNRRTRPLVIAGPPGVRQRIEAVMEAFFPGSTRVERRFTVEFVEWKERVAHVLGAVTVTPYPVDHPSGAPPFALRIEGGGRIVTYSGDTAWTESLVDAARGADLFVCEAYVFDRPVKFHLDYRTIERERARLECGRVVLAHMGADMLAHAPDVAFDCAEDGLTIDV